MTHSTSTLSVLGLALALTACDAPESSDAALESSASDDEVGEIPHDGDGEDDGSPPIAGFGEDTGESGGGHGDGGVGEGFAVEASDDDEGGGEASDDGGSSDGGDDLEVGCLELTECMDGRPYALAPCAAEVDLTPMACGYTLTCTRGIRWVDGDGAPMAPPTLMQIGYMHEGETDFTNVGYACFAPEDDTSCVVPCDVFGGPPGAPKSMRITYVCSDASVTRTQVVGLGKVSGTIVLGC